MTSVMSCYGSRFGRDQGYCREGGILHETGAAVVIAGDEAAVRAQTAVSVSSKSVVY
jgi:hypothetical protein